MRTPTNNPHAGIKKKNSPGHRRNQLFDSSHLRLVERVLIHRDGSRSGSKPDDGLGFGLDRAENPLDGGQGGRDGRGHVVAVRLVPTAGRSFGWSGKTVLNLD